MGNFAYTKSRRQSPADAEESHFLAEPLSAAEEHATAANPSPASGDTAQASHDFGQIAVEPAPANAPQMKLRLSQPEDTHEQEANAVADEVLRMPAPPTSPAGTTATTTANASMSDALPETAGQPLDSATRAYMEPRFGHDFGQIRIYTDEQAAASAADFGARAYTVGSDIVFGAGEYAPDSATGRHLIAHELTHVVQQGGGSAPAGTVHREPEGGTAVHEPEAAPDDTASSLAQDIGATADIRPKDDIKIIHDIIRDQVHVIDAWTAGLTDFKAALDSSPDKVPTSSYFGAIAKIMTESGFGLLGENLGMIVEIGEAAVNPMELAAKVGLAIVEEYNKGKEAAEVEEKNKAKVAVSDFFTLHNDRFTELKKVTVDAEEKLSEYVGAKRDVASASLKRKSRKHSGGKHSWGMEENTAYEKYINIKMVLDSTYEEVHARAAYWKPSVAVRALTEEWVRQSESKHLLGDEKGGHSGGSILVPGTPGEHAARVIVYLNKDLTPREAYIEGYGGKELGHQLLLQAQANHQSGVDVWHLKVPHTVTIVGDSGWVGTKVDFDVNGKSLAQYNDLEREDMIKIEHLVRNGLPLFTKIDGDA